MCWPSKTSLSNSLIAFNSSSLSLAKKNFFFHSICGIILYKSHLPKDSLLPQKLRVMVEWPSLDCQYASVKLKNWTIPTESHNTRLQWAACDKGIYSQVTVKNPVIMIQTTQMFAFGSALARRGWRFSQCKCMLYNPKTWFIKCPWNLTALCWCPFFMFRKRLSMKQNSTQCSTNTNS